MKNQDNQPKQQWAEDWLDSVVDGRATMSQRTRSSVVHKGGSIEAVRAMAQAKGVHLMLLTDDKGKELLVASMHPFTVVC